MRVEEIRPDADVERYIGLHATDVERLLARSDSFVEVSCPACDGHHRRERFRKSGFRFVECVACGTLYISPRPPTPLLTDFYNHARSFALYNSRIFPATEVSRRTSIFAPRAARVVELCRRYLSAAPELLVDVGAGFGTFCEEIQKLGYFAEVLAVEPSRDLAATCRRKGVVVVEQPIEVADIRGATVVVSFELIEHLFCPRDFLLACAEALVEDGLLILTTPNIRGFDLAILGAASDNIDGPEHLNYFHVDSLRHLVTRCGLEVVEVLTPGKLDAELVRKKTESGELDPASLHPFVREILVTRWPDLGESFQRFIAEHGLSSHMWIVARKPRNGAGD